MLRNKCRIPLIAHSKIVYIPIVYLLHLLNGT